MISFKIREAVASDACAIAHVHVDSWKSTYAGIVPQEYLNGLSYEKRKLLWDKNIPLGGVFVAENQNGEIFGFASGGKERSGEYEGYDGELYAIYLLQEYQKQGAGKALFQSIVKELKQQGYRSLLVNVLADNQSYHFYESLGAKKLDTVAIPIAGKQLTEHVYGWSEL